MSAHHDATDLHRCLSINQQAQEQAPLVPETTVDNPSVPVSQLASASDVSAQTPTTSMSIVNDHADRHRPLRSQENLNVPMKEHFEMLEMLQAMGEITVQRALMS